MTLLHIISGVTRIRQVGKALDTLEIESIKGEGIGTGEEFFVAFPPVCVGSSWYIGFASGHVCGKVNENL